MTNAEFIKEFGKYEFKNLDSEIYQKLFIAKTEKKIKSFKCSNRKKCAIINLNNGKSVSLEYAKVYSLKI